MFLDFRQTEDAVLLGYGFAESLFKNCLYIWLMMYAFADPSALSMSSSNRLLAKNGCGDRFDYKGQLILPSHALIPDIAELLLYLFLGGKEKLVSLRDS